MVPGAVPSMVPAGRKCFSNIRQVTLGFHLWSQDRNEKLPWMVGGDEGGSQSLPVEAAYQFLPIAGIIDSPVILSCPSDKAVVAKSTWEEYTTNALESLSYFAGICANGQTPDALLVGDRNLGELSPLSECTNATGMVAPGISNCTFWGKEIAIHGTVGNVGLVDGSAQQLNTPGLRARAASGTPRICNQNHILLPCPECSE